MDSVIRDLDLLDRQLVHALQIDGRVPFSRIAAVLGVSDRTVARRYHRLRAGGVLRVIGTPESHSLGLVDWAVRIQCAPGASAEIAAALAERADTSWVGLASGGTEITCITRARGGSAQGSMLLSRLPRTPRITGVTAHCILRMVAGTSGWPGRTAALDARQSEELARPASGAPSRGVVPTAADHRLFAALAEDGRAAVGDLAAATGWSESTVRRRIDELRTAGVLYFEIDIDPALYGFTHEAILWLTVAPAELTAVAEALAGHPEVAYAAAVTGPANMMAVVIVRDADALYDYLATRVGALPGVRGAETTPVTRHVKRSGTLLVTRPRSPAPRAGGPGPS
ncbi:Lrp/AsnC family transcriptional regulator [Streptomyces griseocarneus]|uniref:Lrp/AsnC family transcriptional regulator n=1 Tax=Streptomyces griseocarneus TaxID=51201 RepID=UPI00167DD826|nr:AsnC family transcriptional regulator [Streptomyces griseocarneus]MBZ6473915.1 AsnC family transcriptional regulator [Streptomyces griseocarneus]GHG65888.1 AsnC family transcriptional regulator [Streptomyces griseocarneus]